MNWLLLRGLSRDQRHWGEFPALFETAVGGEAGDWTRPASAPSTGARHRSRCAL
ncbi:hypothetical protein [Nocardia sp. JMUB6875]|uniref:hypothetical protein n=1 Tax=Nocardia sp. JMUB6875 TaxID=3158170 RepID=UPI0034E87F6C